MLAFPPELLLFLPETPAECTLAALRTCAEELERVFVRIYAHCAKQTE